MKFIMQNIIKKKNSISFTVITKNGVPDICAKNLYKHKPIKCNACSTFFSPQLTQKFNKNVKDCGVYLVIKIQCMKNVNGRVVPPSGILINCNTLMEKLETLQCAILSSSLIKCKSVYYINLDFIGAGNKCPIDELRRAQTHGLPKSLL